MDMATSEEIYSSLPLLILHPELEHEKGVMFTTHEEWVIRMTRILASNLVVYNSEHVYVSLRLEHAIHSFSVSTLSSYGYVLQYFDSLEELRELPFDWSRFKTFSYEQILLESIKEGQLL